MTEKVEVSRKTVDALCVFAGVFVVQSLVPSPLDHLLLPGAISYWFVSSKQHSWILDKIYENGKVFLSNMQNIKNDYMASSASPDSTWPNWENVSSETNQTKDDDQSGQH